MNRISRLLPPNNVVTHLQVTSKKRLFEQAGLLFENNHGIERGKVFDSLFARERLGSTGLGEGVAIPHGRIKGLKDALAAVVRLAEPIPFEAPDGQPVSLVVFLLVPEHATEEHLELLSELAELLSDRAIRDSLMSADDPAQIHRVAGLADEIGGAERPRMAGIGVVVLTGKDDDAQFRCQFQQFGNEREPLVRAMRQGRQTQVDQCQCRRLA